jgi:hypothetical protein
MAKQSTPTNHLSKTKRRRPGVHSKKKTSASKQSKHYVKLNVGQG